MNEVKILYKEDLFHTVRYRLSNGWFMDYSKIRCHRYYPEHPYSVFEPGASFGGFAAFRASGRTQKEVMRILNKAEG